MHGLAGSLPSMRRRLVALASVAVLIGGTAVANGPAEAAAPNGVVASSSSVRASNGRVYSITNHLTREVRAELAYGARRHEWLLVWAGDESTNLPFPSTTSDPDFLAVVDVTKGSRTYGKVVNTVTVDTVFGNEPFKMQYQWHKGDKVFAGGMMSDTTYVFDVKRLPEVTLSGVVPPSATRCGAMPAYYHVLSDGSAYSAQLSSGDVPGPCRYTNGETRIGNGPAGTPGEIVRISPTGEVLAEVPASLAGSEGGTVVPPSPLFPGSGPTSSCMSLPALPQPSCANPYGIAVREDLRRMVTGDFGEIRHTNLGSPPPEFSVRDTVRIFDITRRNNPRLLSVSHLPAGPRTEVDARLTEPFGSMEAAVTNRSRHRGAFTATTNGAVYYTPDITARHPRWRQVYDDFNAFTTLFPTNTPASRADGGGRLQVSPDDRFLFRIVQGGGPFSPGDVEDGLLMVLDLRPLLAAGRHPRCTIDTMAEVAAGGAEADCPKLVSVVPIRDVTTGGPNVATLDTFRVGHGGFYRETAQVRRVATTNYFLANTIHDGDHRVCLFDVSARGVLALDTSFEDEVLGSPCVDFDRVSWPHGDRGNARPHGVLFAVADRDIR